MMRGPITINRTRLKSALRICSKSKTAKGLANLPLLRALMKSPHSTADKIAARGKVSRSHVFKVVQWINAGNYSRLWRYGSGGNRQVVLDRSPLMSPAKVELMSRLETERDLPQIGTGPGKAKRHPHPASRIEAVLLLRTTGMAIAAIARKLQCHTRDVRRWGVIYQQNGLEGLCNIRMGRPPKKSTITTADQPEKLVCPSLELGSTSPLQGYVSREAVEFILNNHMKSSWIEDNPSLNRQYLPLSGMRGVGKSTLARHVFGDEAAYFDCEDASVRRQLNEPETALAAVTQRFIVLDEIGQLANPHEVQAAAMFLPVAKRVLAITSAPLPPPPAIDVIRIDAIAPYELRMQPLMWDERRALVQQRPTAKPFEQSLVCPGLPGLSAKPETIGELYREWTRSVFEHDLRNMCPCNATQFAQVVETTMAQSGNRFAPGEAAARCGLSRACFHECFRLLQGCGVIWLVPFVDSAADSGAMLYAADTGFVHQAQSATVTPANLQRHQQTLWRHLVLLELRHGLRKPDRVRTWQSKNGDTVDFVLETANNEWVAIQCDWSGCADTDSLKAFRRIHPRGLNLVVSPRAVTKDMTEGLFKYRICEPKFIVGLPP